MSEHYVSSTKETRAATKIVTNSKAPQDERKDAYQVLAKKALPAVQTISMNEIVKSVTKLEMARRRQEGLAKSGNIQPLNTLKTMGYLPRPGYSAEQLRMMVANDPVLQAIVLTRARQVSRLAVPRDNDRELGFRVKLRGKHRLEDNDRERIHKLEQYILSCGTTYDFFERQALGRDDLITYLRKATIDSLTLDSMPLELIRTINGDVDGWVHVDGATVFLCDSFGIDDDIPPPDDALEDDLPDREHVKGVEVVDGKVVSWFARDELLYRVRNPRSSLQHNGYGLAEPELMVKVVTAFLNGMTYNSKAYQDNHFPPGFLTVVGDFNQEDIEDFKSSWQAYVTGVENAWKIPVLVAQGGEPALAQYTTINATPNDMVFMKWLTFLISIQTSIYGISPEEIGFEGFSNTNATMSNGSIESKLSNSQEIGLHPLLQHHQSTLDLLLKEVDEDAQFVWTGFEDGKDVWERDKLVLTFGELRERQGLERTGNDTLDNAPINSAMMTLYMQTLQQGDGDEGMGEGIGSVEGFAGENLDAIPPEQNQEQPEQNVEPKSDSDAFSELAELFG